MIDVRRVLRTLTLSLCAGVLCACSANDAPLPTIAPLRPSADIIAAPTSAPTPSFAQTQSPALPYAALSVPTPADINTLYKSRVNELNLRSTPSKDDDNIIGQIGYEDQVRLIANEGEFSRVITSGGTQAYCFTEYLVPADVELYAYLGEESGKKSNALVDLRLHLPDAQYELLFATNQNVLGKPLYARAIPLFQKDSLPKLKKAFDTFRKDGYILKIYDAYRPISVQRRLFAVVQNSHWIANPDTTASNHNRGCAVDISLVDAASGAELDFPTPMHTFTADAARNSKSWTDKQRENVNYMTEVMKICGFSSIKSEWWHYADTNKNRYMTTDIDLGKLNMLPKKEMDE